MNKILFFLLTLFTLAVVGCSTSRTYYTEYDTTDISYVVDSIVSSGTVMGQWKEWRFTLDDGRVDNFGFTALYDAKGVGDFNGDGVDDFAVLMPQAADGRLHLFFGEPNPASRLTGTGEVRALAAAGQPA